MSDNDQKKTPPSEVRMKVSEKGAVSVYGMGRFPVTSYKEQWLKLLEMPDEIRTFMSANTAKQKTKEQRRATSAFGPTAEPPPEAEVVIVAVPPKVSLTHINRH